MQSRQRTLAGGHGTFYTFVPPSPPPISPADPQTLLHQAVQQALAAQQSTSTGHTPPHGTVPAATPPASPADWCPLHQVAMEQRRNAKGTWYSH